MYYLFGALNSESQSINFTKHKNQLHDGVQLGIQEAEMPQNAPTYKDADAHAFSTVTLRADSHNYRIVLQESSILHATGS